MYTCSIQSFKILASFCSWAGRFESYLVENSRKHIFAWCGSYNYETFLNTSNYFCIICRLDITPEDPRWVGAWWVGFLVASVLFLVAAIPISMYGAELPSKLLIFIYLSLLVWQKRITENIYPTSAQVIVTAVYVKYRIEKLKQNRQNVRFFT